MVGLLIGATGAFAQGVLHGAPADTKADRPAHTSSAAAKSLRIAVVQMKSSDHDIEGNLKRAGAFAEEAAAQGTQFVLFPEFMPTGSYLSFDT